MQRRIVVPLDGSPFGEQALPLAVELAKQQRADLELVHVLDALPPYLVQGAPPIDPAFDAEVGRDRQRYLERVAERLRTTAPVNVTCLTLQGTDVGATLAAHLAERHADLAVLATHGRGGVNRLWLGSVAMDLVQQSSTSVLLVRAGESGQPEDMVATPRRILIP